MEAVDFLRSIRGSSVLRAHGLRQNTHSVVSPRQVCPRQVCPRQVPRVVISGATCAKPDR